jgi:hypothetical protein
MICRFKFCRWQNSKPQEEKISRLRREIQNNGFGHKVATVLIKCLPCNGQNPFWFLRHRRKNFSPSSAKKCRRHFLADATYFYHVEFKA